MDMGITGKRALVLAGGGGLGSAIARALAEEGVTVLVADVNGEAAQRCAQQIQSAGGMAHAVQWDLGALDAVPAKLDRCRELAQGDIDVVVNNTGGPPPGQATGIGEEAWRKHFDAMVLSVISITDGLLPAMRKNGWGRVITSTSSGVIAPIPNLALSNSLRSSLVAWSKTLAGEVGRDGVTANVVVPGRIATGRIEELDAKRAEREGRTVESVRQESTGSIPLKRYGDPMEYGRTVTFLASQCASYITGSVIRVDGGLVASI